MRPGVPITGEWHVSTELQSRERILRPLDRAVRLELRDWDRIEAVLDRRVRTLERDSTPLHRNLHREFCFYIHLLNPSLLTSSHVDFFRRELQTDFSNLRDAARRNRQLQLLVYVTQLDDEGQTLRRELLADPASQLDPAGLHELLNEAWSNIEARTSRGRTALPEYLSQFCQIVGAIAACNLPSDTGQPARQWLAEWLDEHRTAQLRTWVEQADVVLLSTSAMSFLAFLPAGREILQESGLDEKILAHLAERRAMPPEITSLNLLQQAFTIGLFTLGAEQDTRDRWHLRQPWTSKSRSSRSSPPPRRRLWP